MLDPTLGGNFDVSGVEQGAKIAAKKTIGDQADASALGAKVKAVKTLAEIDTNGDGQLSPADCPFPLGSVEAKKWFYDVLDPYVKSLATPELQAKYGSKCVGMFNGKALVPGQAGPDQGDFQYMKAKLQIIKGFDAPTAAKITGKAAFQKYGWNEYPGSAPKTVAPVK